MNFIRNYNRFGSLSLSMGGISTVPRQTLRQPSSSESVCTIIDCDSVAFIVWPLGEWREVPVDMIFQYHR